MVKYMCTTNGVHLKPNYSTWKPDHRQQEYSAACVIAQQYSSTTRVSLRFHCRKKKTGARR